MLEYMKMTVKSLGSRLTRSVAGPHARAILTETGAGRFLVEVEDFTIGRRLRHDGSYGTGEISRISELVTHQSRVLVVGAHVGTLAIPLARRVAHVEAIEATPNTFELLRLNVLLNDIGNCHPVNLAASDSRETIEMLQGSVNSGGNKRMPITMARRYRFDNPAIVRVDAAPLDSVYPDEDFDLILMDIEGSEYFALCGMPRLLSRASALVVEFVPHHLESVAGVSVRQFLEPITREFTTMEVPSLGRLVVGDEIEELLKQMLRRGQSEDGLIFRREPDRTR